MNIDSTPLVKCQEDDPEPMENPEVVEVACPKCGSQDMILKHKPTTAYRNGKPVARLDVQAGGGGYYVCNGCGSIHIPETCSVDVTMLNRQERRRMQSVARKRKKQRS